MFAGEYPAGVFFLLLLLLINMQFLGNGILNFIWTWDINHKSSI